MTSSSNSKPSNDVNHPTNNLVGPLLTDFYQISMAYAYWKGGRANDQAVFELFYRKNPFNGEFCIFAGIDEVFKYIENFRFRESDITYLKKLMPYCDPDFWPWLKALDCSEIKLYSMQQGEIVFPREPLVRVEGPLAIAQLLETTLLNLINYPSLIATNALRMKIASKTDVKRILPNRNNDIQLLEFGLRRAQGPDGGLSGSKYAFLGGFTGTSNILAGKLNDIPVRGTHAHAFVMSYRIKSDLKSEYIISSNGESINLYELVIKKRIELGFSNTSSNTGELLAFIAYAQSNPNGFVALVDTYDTLNSGVLNFLSVGLALYEIGYQPIGIRLDSGDLAYLSRECRKLFINIDKLLDKSIFSYCKIMASNDIDEAVILSLNNQGHEIDSFAVGTHLITCYDQPALGCVYKLVEINNEPRIKLSQDTEKIVIPSKKFVYRLIGKDNLPIIDLMIRENEQPPQVNTKILCRHPFIPGKRAYVTPSTVLPLLHLYWDGNSGGLQLPCASLQDSQKLCWERISTMREDHIRPLNPTPYKVSISNNLFEFTHNLILAESPIADLS